MAQLTDIHAQRRVVAKLIGYCEAIAESGLVGEKMECKLRALVAETLSVFGMQHNDQENTA